MIFIYWTTTCCCKALYALPSKHFLLFSIYIGIYSNLTDHNPAHIPNNMKAIWNNQVIAESDKTIVVENNHYFPADSLKKAYFKPSETHSTCPWKGLASYYSLDVDGQHNKDAAWYYPAPKDAAKQIANYVAFWKGVKVTA